jgi:hypothetical protein
MGWGLRDAVGLTNAGTQCPNHAIDQQQIGELLDAVARLPVEIPGIPHEGTLIENLPPIEDGVATPELCEAIRRFQAGEGDLVADSRVDVNGATWNRLISLVQPGMEPPGPVPLLLSVRELEIIELPASASGLPAATYSIQGNPARAIPLQSSRDQVLLSSSAFRVQSRYPGLEPIPSRVSHPPILPRWKPP